MRNYIIFNFNKLFQDNPVQKIKLMYHYKTSLMKRFLVINTTKVNRLNLPKSWRIIPGVLMVLLFSGLLTTAQSIPVVSVRFANPRYADSCAMQTYCVDVEFMSDTPDQQLFGMNVRFFYDDNILEYAGATIADGYMMPEAPEVLTGASGLYWGFDGPPDWVNGTLQYIGDPIVVLPTTQWLKLMTICFHIDDPTVVAQDFCPSLVWDLQEDPPEFGGGFLTGDDGVVITLVDLSYQQESVPSTENVVQFNWQYGGAYFGFPVSLVCITPIFCIPVSNWALFLGIGLMIIATLFIYRKRLS
jgi:hypothetical protein